MNPVVSSILEVDAADAVFKRHVHANKSDLDSYSESRISALETRVSTVQQPYGKAYKDNNASNVFQLPKTPDVIMDVWVLDGDNGMAYLRTSNYSVSGRNVTILNPAMTDATEVKIIYTSKE